MQFLNLKNWTHYKERIRHTPLLAIHGIIYYTLGLDIFPFYLYQEDLRQAAPTNIYEILAPNISFRLLDQEDMKTISDMLGQQISEQVLRQRLDEGMWYMGLFDGPLLVAFTWCNLNECSFKDYKSPLRANEAYIAYAYTLPSHRGKGLGPLLRYHTNKFLADHGRTQIFSATERFNTSAMRYRKKLKAKIVASGIYVELFRRWGRTFCFKRWVN